MGGMEKTTVYLTAQQKTALARAAEAEGRSEARLIRAGVDGVGGGPRARAGSGGRGGARRGRGRGGGGLCRGPPPPPPRGSLAGGPTLDRPGCLRPPRPASPGG